MNKRSKSELTRSPSITLTRDKYAALMCDTGLYGLNALFTEWKWSSAMPFENKTGGDCFIELENCVLRHTLDEERGLIKGETFKVSMILGTGEMTFYMTEEDSIDEINYVSYNCAIYPEKFVESQGQLIKKE